MNCLPAIPLYTPPPSPAEMTLYLGLKGQSRCRLKVTFKETYIYLPYTVIFFFSLFPLETATAFDTHKDPLQHSHATEIYNEQIFPDSDMPLLTSSSLKGSWKLNVILQIYSRQRGRTPFISNPKKESQLL